MNIPFLSSAAIAALVITCVLIPALMRLAPRMGLQDDPGARKRHARPTPLVGGIAITIAALVTIAFTPLWIGPTDETSWGFTLSIVLLLVAGLLDDTVELRHWVKALLQIIALLLGVVFSGLRVYSIGPLFGGEPILLGLLAIPFTVFCLLLYINALNLIDGMDGLAGGIAFVAFAFLAFVAWRCGAGSVLLTIIVFASATIGFLAYNLRTPWRNRASVFLGDSGSMVLGLIVGWCAIRLAAYPFPPSVNPMGIAWILALPVMDTFVVMVRRLLLRRNPFAPDRLHLHHVLVDLGLPPGKATMILIWLSTLYGLAGILTSILGAPEWTLFVAFITMMFVHAAFVLSLHDPAVSASRLSRRQTVR